MYAIRSYYGWKLKNAVTIPNGVSDGKVTVAHADADMTSAEFLAASPENAGRSYNFV